MAPAVLVSFSFHEKDAEAAQLAALTCGLTLEDFCALAVHHATRAAREGEINAITMNRLTLGICHQHLPIEHF